MNNLDRDIQLMHELNALTPSSLSEFEALHESERGQIVRGIAIEDIRESAAADNIPLKPGWSDGLDMSAAVEMARQFRAPEPSRDANAALVGLVPLREASAGSSAGALARGDDPAHVVVADLADVVPEGHSDRPLVDELHSKGAALSADDKTAISALSARHLQSADAAVAESTTLLREAGIPLAVGSGSSPREPRQFTPEAALRATGIPLRSDSAAGGLR
jgi:hypothetical protein